MACGGDEHLVREGSTSGGHPPLESAASTSATIDPSSPATEPPVDNAAVRAHRMASDTLARRDRAAFVATRTDDFVVTVHVPDDCPTFLPTAADIGSDPDAAIGLWPGRDDPSEEQVIAIRGDDCCLVRVVDDVASDIFEHLVVLRSRGGRIASEDWFAAEQRAEALELLGPATTLERRGSLAPSRSDEGAR